MGAGQLTKALKDNYLAANQEKREKLNKLMFSTVRITRRDYIATHDEDDPHLTAAPFYFVWNQPFKALNEIGFIQGMAEENAEASAASKTGKLLKSKKWRAFYNHLSTALRSPSAIFRVQQLRDLASAA